MLKLIVLAAVGGYFAVVAPAFALCPKPASASDLSAFNGDPVKWVRANKGSQNIGSKMVSLAAAAVNARNAGFGHGLYLALGHASGADGAEIGKALRELGNNCASPSLEEDRGDKLYIADNIVPNIASNTEANQAFGSGDAVTASTGGGGGAGGGGGGSNAGVGSVGAGPQTGGANNSAIPDNTPAVVPRPAQNFSFSVGGGSFTTQSTTSTVIGSQVVD